MHSADSRPHSNTSYGRLACAAIAGLCCALLLSACATTRQLTDYDETVRERAKLDRNPRDEPIANATGFRDALRCMDYLMITYGVKNLSILVEDIPDSTKKVSASSKDMIISAVSQMSRRSRGINLIAFSINDQTLGAVIGLGTRDKLIPNAPDFTIRGSISQFDDSVVRKQGDAGIGLGAFSAGAAGQGQADILALDLSVIETASLQLVPGSTSNNSMLVVTKGAGADSEVNTRKFGLNFNFVLARSEGRSQALRTLVELATIELVGKLTKIPYWTCLGASPDSSEVQAEISDWWETLSSDTISLVAYLQQQMIARGLYGGAINGTIDDALIHAIGIYKEAMGMPNDASINLEFFNAYLRADHTTNQKLAGELLKRNPAPAPSAPASGEDKSAAVVAAVSSAQTDAQNPAGDSTVFVYVNGVNGPRSVYRRGQPFAIDVTVDQDTNLYCYLIDENRVVNQFFPNLMQPQPRVAAGSRLQFPGEYPFRLITSPRGLTETVACFGSPKSLGSEPLKGIKTVPDANSLVAAFARIAGSSFGKGVYDVVAQQ